MILNDIIYGPELGLRLGLRREEEGGEFNLIKFSDRNATPSHTILDVHRTSIIGDKGTKGNRVEIPIL